MPYHAKHHGIHSSVLLEEYLEKLPGLLAERTDTPEKLVRFLNAYVEFNSSFGAGVAQLASKIAFSRYRFTDPTMEEPYNDRSYLVAAHIFNAARDEFQDRDYKSMAPHRSLAQAFLWGVSNYYNIPVALSTTLRSFRMEVCYGYSGSSFDTTFHGMGFHLASEVLADREFTLLDELIRKDAKLLEYLQNSVYQAHGSTLCCYDWVSMHSGLGSAKEQEHSSSAQLAIQEALKYVTAYPDKDETPEGVRERSTQEVEEGVKSFLFLYDFFFQITA